MIEKTNRYMGADWNSIMAALEATANASGADLISLNISTKDDKAITITVQDTRRRQGNVD